MKVYKPEDPEIIITRMNQYSLTREALEHQIASLEGDIAIASKRRAAFLVLLERHKDNFPDPSQSMELIHGVRPEEG